MGGAFCRHFWTQEWTPPESGWLLLGAGGAAKAVALKLVQQGCVSLTVCNRTLERAEMLCQFNAAVMRAVGFDAATLRLEASRADLLVNCTSLGMGGVAGQFEDFHFLDALPHAAAVCDLIYHPAETELLAQAGCGATGR